MIKKIKSIQDFGVFKNYKNSGLAIEFNDKNIIYGWNYSGKTTLSRLFLLLDKDYTLDSDYTSSQYEIELSDSGKIINQDNRLESNIKIKVFNSDFIKENLGFDNENKKIKGISFDVGGGIEIRSKIKKNEEIIDRVNASISKYTKNIDKFNEFESKFSKEAKRIKNECFNSLIDFDKGHFKTIMKSFDKPLESYTSLKQEELNEIKENSLTSKPKDEITIIKPEINFPNILKDTIEILNEEPKKSVTDAILSLNNDFYDWGKTGLELYSEKYKSIKVCAFCGNEIKQNRLDYLNSFYTNEAAKLRKRIDEIKRSIKLERNQIKNLEWSQKSANDLIESCQNEFSMLTQSYGDISNSYFKSLDTLDKSLNEKYNESLFVKKEIGLIDLKPHENLSDWIDKIEKVFIKHNEIVSKFEETQKIARDKYKKYLVATFLLNEDYFIIRKAKDIEERHKERCLKLIKVKSTENISLSFELKNITKGKEQLEDFIKKFLNRDDINIDVTEDDHFILKREKNVAKNLSEGEKTAIAFAHFMVMLESNFIESQLQDTIIFIDDPISSLDANHIAQVSSLINSFFFRKGLDPANPEKVTNCFNQIFISTHNFDFFSFLKDANNLKRRKKILDSKGEKIEVPSLNLYLVRRPANDSSELVSMPRALSKYNSEYVYLFSEIQLFKSENYPEDKSYMIPNVIRRFLEIYTLMKLPGNTDEIDNRVKTLIGDVNELKILHNFSHFTSFERARKHNELIFKLNDIIEDLFTLLKKDKDHLASLFEGIGKEFIETV